jgi:hypothetical protein
MPHTRTLPHSHHRKAPPHTHTLGQVGLGPTPPSHKRGRQGDPWADALEDSTHTLHRAQFKALSWLDQAKLLERWGAPVCVLSDRCECPLCM